MKKIFKKLVVFILTLEAKIVLKKYKPKVVAITGSVGKTSAKDAVAVVLKSAFSVRKSIKSYNSEIGVPLVVLGLENAWFNPFLWMLNFFKGLKLILLKAEYPEWLVLEMGVERPGDMGRLISWIKPDISVVTALSDVPVHVEYFKNPSELIKEKSKILKRLGINDHAILNNDDISVFSLRDKTKAKSITYGFDEGADLLVSNYMVLVREGGEEQIPEGVTFKVDYEGSSVPIRIFNAFGRHHVYPALVALAVGHIAGLNFVEMGEALSVYASPPGRLKLVDGVRGSFILDDSYNASPMAVSAALETVKDMPAKRKIAVLGDMLELGKYTIDAHKRIGGEAASVCEIVFTVGPRAKFIAGGLRDKGFSNKNIFEFSTSDDVKKEVEKIIEPGDLILVKGSQGMRMERVVEEIMAHPEEKEKLLVRQDKKWLSIK